MSSEKTGRITRVARRSAHRSSAFTAMTRDAGWAPGGFLGGFGYYLNVTLLALQTSPAGFTVRLALLHSVVTIDGMEMDLGPVS